MSTKGRSSGSFRAGEGDWVCPDPKCGNVNFSRRTQCNRCGKDKSEGIETNKKGGIEIGKAMAERSKGLFSADDWQCKMCGNVNWARRSTCNMCNAPKFGKIEERTGYGGGYMERDEVVEYVKREDSDDEYDEFGRKKKKYRGTLPKATALLPAPKCNTEEEEEEEEEDDDGDVSKYKLESDEDEEEDVDLSKYEIADSEEEKKDNKSSRSRSNSSSSKSSRSSSSSSSQSGSRSGRSSSSSSSRSGSRSRKVSKRSHSGSRSRSSSYSRGHSKRKRRSHSSSWSRSRSKSPGDKHKNSRRYRRSRSRSRS